jgi:hypothetical protein
MKRFAFQTRKIAQAILIARHRDASYQPIFQILSGGGGAQQTEYRTRGVPG